MQKYEEEKISSVELSELTLSNSSGRIPGSVPGVPGRVPWLSGRVHEYLVEYLKIQCTIYCTKHRTQDTVHKIKSTWYITKDTVHNVYYVK